MAPTDSATRLSGDAPAAITPQGLADRRELALIAVERTQMPMVVSDPRQPDNPIVLANQAFIELTGYAPDEIVGRNCRFLQGPGSDRVEVAKMRAAIAEERDITVDLINYRKNGTSFWSEIYVSPVHDDDGQLLYYFASQRDLTSKKRAEALAESEARLLREVDHRTRNAMTLVQSIVRLTRGDDKASYARAVEARVGALTRSHTMLADAGWSSIPIARLIAAEAAGYDPAQIVANGPDTDVPANAVQPLGLLLHELLANAGSHGALSVGEGRIAIDWQLADDGKRIVIELHESGGPKPDPTPARGVGSEIIRTLAERQLNGTAEFHWHPAGLRSRLELGLAG